MINEICLSNFDYLKFPLFEREAFSIPELYFSLVSKFDSGRIKRCNITLFEHENFPPRRDILGVAESFQVFDFDKYLNSSYIDRKSMQLRVVHQGMLDIADQYNWSHENFDVAYQACLESDLIFRKQIRKRKINPNKKYYLSLAAICDLNFFKIEWMLSDKKGNIVQKGILVEGEPSSIDIIYQLDFQWVDECNFIVEQNYKGVIINTWKVCL